MTSGLSRNEPTDLARATALSARGRAPSYVIISLHFVLRAAYSGYANVKNHIAAADVDRGTILKTFWRFELFEKKEISKENCQTPIPNF